MRLLILSKGSALKESNITACKKTTAGKSSANHATIRSSEQAATTSWSNSAAALCAKLLRDWACSWLMKLRQRSKAGKTSVLLVHGVLSWERKKSGWRIPSEGLTV